MFEEPQALSNAANSPTLNGKYLGIISTDFALVSEFLKETAYQIRTRGFSENPIFVVSQNFLQLGSKLIGKGEMNENQWTYNASFIEEFLQRQIVGEEALESFKENYKNPDEFCCLFVLDGDFANFIYMPYPED